jgi:hypothetical protein
MSPETETPVDATPAGADSAPLVSTAELAAARTSHLAGFNPPAAEPSVDGEPPMTIPDQKFPRRLKDAIELRKELQAEPATTARDQKVKDLLLAALNAHIFTIEQIPAVKPPTPAQHTALANRQTDHAKAFHLDQLAKQFPAVKDLLDAHDERVRDNAQMSKILTALQKERDDLAAQVAALTPKT